MDSLRQDVRFAIRTLRRSPGTTFLAVVCLALGIGATTAIYSVVQAVLLSALPYREPSRLVRAFETYVSRGERGIGSVSPPNYHEWRAQTRVFEDLAAYTVTTRDLGDVTDPERLRGIRSTTNLFGVLGVAPLIGRTFLGSDEPPFGSPVVIVSEGLWRRRFAADPSLVGSSLSLNGVRHIVVGVMPAAFDFPLAATRTDFWVVLDWTSIGGIANRGNRSLNVVGRLARGVDSTRATAELATLARRLEVAYPETQRGRGILVTSLGGDVVGSVRPALLVLVGAVGVVLVIVCANVANLMLARASGRRREVAIRTALGAARTRLVRQLLTESAVLAIVGGVLGIGVGYACLFALRGMAATILPRSEMIGLNGSVLLFAAGLSLATGLAVGILPALRASQTDLREDLSESSARTSASVRRRRTLDALITAEIALSLLLLVAAGLVIRSFVALMDTHAGFDPDRLLTFKVAAPAVAMPDSLRYEQFYGPVLARVRAIPGVRSAGFTSLLPIQDGATDRYFSIVGRPEEADPQRRPDAEIRVVSERYFQTMRIPVVAGREFDDRDGARTERVVIVNDELARRFFPGASPLGARLDPGTGEPGTIVGVVKSVRQMGLDRAPRSEFYLAATQARYNTGAMAYVVSTSGRPEELSRSVREAVRAVAPQPVYQLATMTDVVSRSLTTRRLVLLLLLAFAALALALCAAGVYGVISYSVSQRTRELGIRMALGARAREVLFLVLVDAVKVMAVGIALGLVAAALLTKALQSILYGVGAHDPVTFLVVPAVIAAVAMLSAAVPAVRAARVDPLAAMRAS